MLNCCSQCFECCCCSYLSCALPPRSIAVVSLVKRILFTTPNKSKRIFSAFYFRPLPYWNERSFIFHLKSEGSSQPTSRIRGVCIFPYQTVSISRACARVRVLCAAFYGGRDDIIHIHPIHLSLFSVFHVGKFRRLFDSMNRMTKYTAQQYNSKTARFFHSCV